MIEGKIISKKSLEDKAVEITIKLNKKITFEPGQFIMIIDKIKETKIQRAYSLACSPTLTEKRGEIILCIKKVEGGLYSSYIYDEVKEGHSLLIKGPFGEMKLNKAPTKTYYFIAAGSGIAPFKSMIDYLIETGNYDKITLIYGNKYERDIIYHQHWKKLERLSSTFKYVPVLSREEKKGYIKGHVQDAIIIDEKGSYFICGMPKMVEEVKSILKDKVAFVDGEGY